MKDIESSINELLTALARPRRYSQPDPAEFSRVVAADLRRERASILEEAGASLPFCASDIAALLDDTLAYLDNFPTLVASTREEVKTRSENVSAVDPGARIVERPHGRVLIVIPANAPLPLAVILPLSLVASGNYVVVAASSGSRALTLRLTALVQRHAPDRVKLWPHGVQTVIDTVLSKESIDTLYFMGPSNFRASLFGRAAEAGVTVIYEGQGIGAALVDDNLSEDRFVETAKMIALSKVRWRGQMCSSPNVILVKRSALNRFARAFSQAADSTLLAAPVSQVLREEARTRLATLAGETNISLLSGHRPFLVRVPDLKTATAFEIFGPVAYLVGYDEFQDIVSELDNLRYRLQLSVFSDDLGFVDDVITRTRLARYTVNRVPSLQNPALPWGNFGKSGTSYVQNFYEKGRIEAIIEEDSPPHRSERKESVKLRLETRCFLWAHPRSRSTAFERAFIERDDCFVLHEPLSKYPYFGVDVARLLGSIENESRFISDSILDDVRFVPGFPRFGFVKDFPYHALAWLTDDFLRNFRHIFLVRHPAPTVHSFCAVRPNFNDEEAGYRELLRLAHRVRYDLGQEIFVVDSDDLACEPQSVMRDTCKFLRIPYDDRMVAWKARDDMPAWSLWKPYHETVLSTRTISSSVGTVRDVALSPDRQRLVTELEPVYQEILEFADVRGGSIARRKP